MKNKKTSTVRNKVKTESVVESIFFKKARAKAAEFINQPKKVFALLSQAWQRTENLNPADAGKSFLHNLKLLFRMIKAYYKKEYTQVPITVIAKAVAAVVYFVFVIDFIPDFIPVFGLMDDAGVIAWVVASIRSELIRFEQWETAKNAAKEKVAV